MKKCLLVSLVGLLSTIMFSCKFNVSSLNQITAEKQTCYVNKQKANEYYKKYGNKMQINSSEAASKINSSFEGSYPTGSNDTEGVKQQAFEKLSNVPSEYLEYIFEKYNIPVNVIDYLIGGCYRGLTGFGYKYGSNNNRVQYPTIIYYSHPSVFAHEFGHASEGYHWEKDPGFENELSEIANIISQKYSDQVSAYLRSYENSNQHSKERETFAELFDTWYCSKAARNILKTNMPEIYEFAEKNLIKPEDEESTNDDDDKNKDKENSNSNMNEYDYYNFNNF